MRRSIRYLRGALIIFGLGLCGGCAVPSFDVPRDDYGQPTVKTIVDRIECEIRDMVRDDRPDDPASFNRLFLINSDYDVIVALSLEVNDSGGLSPSTTYVSPIKKGVFTFAANATLSESRDHTFSENLQISTRQILEDWRSGIPHDCPMPDTFLSGTLGLKDIVSMAASSPDLDESKTGTTVFGGSVQFIITKSLSATGPSWQFVNFTNIADLASLSEVNTDKITLSFAPGNNRGKRLARARGFNPVAYQFLQQQILNSISSRFIMRPLPR